jgi:hypothetical protein
LIRRARRKDKARGDGRSGQETDGESAMFHAATVADSPEAQNRFFESLDSPRTQKSLDEKWGAGAGLSRCLTL